MVLNCDVLFHPRLLADLLTAVYDDALLVCARANRPYSSEEMRKYVRRGGLVHAIDKTLADADSDSENIGIAKFSRAGAAVLVNEINQIVTSGDVFFFFGGGGGGGGGGPPRFFFYIVVVVI